MAKTADDRNLDAKKMTRRAAAPGQQKTVPTAQFLF
jgi:hypothetical protein